MLVISAHKFGGISDVPRSFLIMWTSFLQMYFSVYLAHVIRNSTVLWSSSLEIMVSKIALEKIYNKCWLVSLLVLLHIL